MPSSFARIDSREPAQSLSKGRTSSPGHWEILLALMRNGELEINAAVVIYPLGGGNVQIRERNFFGALRREAPQGLADDGVVLYFFLVLIAEDQDRRRVGIVILLGA